MPIWNPIVRNHCAIAARERTNVRANVRANERPLMHAPARGGGHSAERVCLRAERLIALAASAICCITPKVASPTISPAEIHSIGDEERNAGMAPAKTTPRKPADFQNSAWARSSSRCATRSSISCSAFETAALRGSAGLVLGTSSNLSARRISPSVSSIDRVTLSRPGTSSGQSLSTPTSCSSLSCGVLRFVQKETNPAMVAPMMTPVGTANASHHRSVFP
ncbi:MAG: hypothetical protein JWN03_7400 [Nocardia sp.]|nr:hypothetical protein [Nocardia sp.]